EIAETKSGVSAIQAQLGETFSQVIALHRQIASLTGGVEVAASEPHAEGVHHGSAPDDSKTFGHQQNGPLARETLQRFSASAQRLDRAGMKCTGQNVALDNGADYRALATHYARSADLISRYWTRLGQLPSDPFPDDDGSLKFAVSTGAYVPGNEVDVDDTATRIPWRHLFSDPDCGVFLVMGQSNAGNHGETRFSARNEVYCLDFLRLQCFAGADPLPGASGTGGSIWSRLGDMLIDKGLFRRVLFVPIAFGGSFVTDWTPGNSMHRRTSLCLNRLQKELGDALIPFSAVFWQQGEAEANHTRMSAAAYKMHFHDIVADLRAGGVFAPIFVARATHCEAGPHPFQNHEAIREAQTDLAKPENGILTGPDIDTIGAEGRSDGCHLSERGLHLCAELWFDVLAQSRSVLHKV
ncbi:MAG TPA: sialate O-acetylesterase, partial [Chthoniobacterales bacterium]